MLDGVQWILFDAVGTLIHADPPVAAAYYAAAQKFGSRLSVEEIGQRFRVALAAEQRGGSPTNETVERERWRRIVGRVIDDVAHAEDKLFDQLWRHFAEPDHWQLYEDVPAALGRLARHGYQLGIASNFDRRLIAIAAGHQGLAACSRVLVSSDIGYVKPDPRFFRAVEERLGARPAEIALVGDDETSDVQGALAAGWRAVRLCRGKSVTPEAIRTLADL